MDIKNYSSITITPEHIEQKAIGDLLAQLRVHANVTQERVAEEMGENTRQPFISQIEGYQKIPALPTMVNYLNAIGYKLVIQKK